METLPQMSRGKGSNKDKHGEKARHTKISRNCQQPGWKEQLPGDGSQHQTKDE